MTGAIRVALAAVLLAPAPAMAARSALGVFDGWAAFRDDAGPQCFAIAEPAQRSAARWRPFVSIASWPRSGVRGQFYARLSRERRANAPITVIIDDRRFELVAGAADAWAPDPRIDARIVAAMRSARTLSIASVAATGGGFADTYLLKGAATAIDAAALGCARG